MLATIPGLAACGTGGGRPVARSAAVRPAPVPEALRPPAVRLGPWALTGTTPVVAPLVDQGLATVEVGTGVTRTVFRGVPSVNAQLRSAGWNHAGDPDSVDGWLVDAYQGGPGTRAKMFQVTSPAGRVVQAVHPLVPGEAPNNSFAAVTPDGQWTLSAEWGTESRLLVYPTPVLNPSAPPGEHLPLAGVVPLRRPVRDLQGCGFATATRLVCASSDPGSDLWGHPDQLLQLDLDHPLTADRTRPPPTASVTDLGQIPDPGTCPGGYEPEGVDLDRSDGVLRVLVDPPAGCGLIGAVYRFVQASGASAG